MEKDLKKAIKQIMKYDFYDSKEKPIEISLKENKTEELLKQAFMNAVLAIEYIKDGDDEDLRKIDDDELGAKLGDHVVNLFQHIQDSAPKKPPKKKESKPKKVKEEICTEEKFDEMLTDHFQKIIETPEDEDVTELDVLLEEAIEEVKEPPKKKKRSTGYDKYGFRKESKCAMIMSLLEQNKFTFKDLAKAVEGKTNIDPRKIVRVVNAKGEFKITRNENGVYIVEAAK